MTESTTTWITAVGRWSLARQALFLSLVFLAFFALAGPLGWLFFGTQGVWAALTATGVCLLSGWLAMLVTGFTSPQANPIGHLLIGSLIRMGLPLLVCLVVTASSNQAVASEAISGETADVSIASRLNDAGFAWFLVAAFCLGLAVETAISVGKLQSNTGPNSAENRPELTSTTGT